MDFNKRNEHAFECLLAHKPKLHKKRGRKKKCKQASRLENPEELQLHHNHEKFLFLAVLLSFAQ
jgi:hypothetical protein